jgi:hypothetical protein
VTRLIVNPPVIRCLLRPSLTEAPSLRRSYPASSVVRTSPPPQTARPVSRELPVDPYRDHRWGFPCCVWSPMPACHRHYPGRSDGACPLVSLHRLRPSLCNSQVGSCNCFFGACSAFTHVMACTLAESPCDPFHRKLRQLRCLRCRFDCYRVERTSSRAGVAPAEVQRLSRRTVTTTNLERCCSGTFSCTCPAIAALPRGGIESIKERRLLGASLSALVDKIDLRAIELSKRNRWPASRRSLGRIAWCCRR